MIRGELVTLRPLEAENLFNLARWHNEALAHLFGPHYVLQSGQAAWYQRYLVDSSNLMFIVEINDKALGKTFSGLTAVGCIGLANIDQHHRHAELGRLIITQSHQGHGYGTDAARALCGYAFKELGMHRLYLYVFADNAVAIRLYEVVGFKVESVMRDYVWKSGLFRDVTVMAWVAEAPQ